jgi:hypothetical protein
LAGLKGSLAAAGAFNFVSPGQLATVPEEFHEPLKRLRQGYDLTAHSVSGGANERLVDELGLADFLADRFTMIGSVAGCREQIKKLAELGVSGVQVSATTKDQEGAIREFAEVMR